MKNIIYCTVALVQLLASCSNTEKKSHLNGAYLTVSYKYYRNDTLIFSVPDKTKGTELKIWSDKYFAFSGKYLTDTSSQDNYGGGTYTLAGDHYIENIVYHVEKYYIGASIKMIMKVKNDTLIQSWPVDENWNIRKDSYFIQTLVRADNKQ